AADAAPRFAGASIPLLVVADTRIGLGELAAHWRGKFRMPLVALTGSNGKTTVKEMLASILREAAGAPAAVLATQGNLNNDIGVPLMLLRLGPGHRYAVIEMGMNHAGEIAYLTRLARPDVALITNAGSAHIEFLKTREGIARAKGEIFEGLAPGGAAVINADDDFAGLWRAAAGARRVVDFGLVQAAAVSAGCRIGPEATELHLRLPGAEVDTKLRVPGLHNVRNALAAAAAAVALDVAPAAIARGLAAFSGVKGRLQRVPAIRGATLIDDTYNANPESVAAALDVLAAAPGKRLLVIGDMGELGSGAAALHAEIGRKARACAVDALLALGEASVHAARAFGPGARHFERIEDLLAELENLLAPGVTVLVKGSRFMRMERVVKSFELPGPAAGA
ncbi:MAG TPA: UDP-N-acetylmuramoyl-tripeptide--D-alanyl-D-alanine ligase, partial [Burkholderiales bacterium]|nr:UDP-N-acetylmuramoyl-tripeptide--D-alanyl-D-alanine ligase [Burkholderiales bacterium]